MRYLLCRPLGGLNDMLVQIEKCAQYAEQTNRTLIIDTNSKNAEFFRDDFSKYFQCNHKNVFLDVNQHKEVLNSLQTFPELLTNRIFEYDSTMWPSKTYAYYYDREDINSPPTPLTFDFSKDYPHPLLVHHMWGGGDSGHFCLLRFRLKRNISDKLIERLIKIDPNLSYHSMHIRHTSYQTDYLEKLPEIKQNFANTKIFLATDNVNVLKDFRDNLGLNNIFSFTNLPETPDMIWTTIPQNPLLTTDAIQEINESAILDLFTLALAKRFHLFPLSDKLDAQHQIKPPQYSGFSKLALNLWQWKVILKYVISRDEIVFGLN